MAEDQRFLIRVNMRDFSEEIEKAVDLLLKVSEHPPEKQKLFDKSKVVYLQVVLFKIPFGAPRKRKFLRLRHSLYGDDPDICLFVPNRKTGVKYKKTTDELIDFCVEYYTELLEKHKIKGITTVMPLKQLRSEYGTYDLRRKLVHRFDLFLCKNSLLYNSRFLSSLGKFFRVAKKEPLGVPFPKEDVDFDPEFQKNIERAIFTSSFFISRFSDNYSIPFGCLRNTKSELKENLQAVLNQILTEGIIPGGFKNIRAMNLWPSQSKPIPLYISTELPVNMKTPRAKSKKKRLRGVEGEISTQPYKKVFVMQNGEVFVTKLNRNSQEPEVSYSEDEDSFDDEESNDEEMKEEKNQYFKVKDKTSKKEEESESENDEDIEKKETKLMKEKILNEDMYTQYQVSRKANEEAEEEEEEEEEQEQEQEQKRLQRRRRRRRQQQQQQQQESIITRNLKSQQNGNNESSNQKERLKKRKSRKAEQTKGILIKPKKSK